jgi:diacylglycerol kinase (ATP)
VGASITLDTRYGIAPSGQVIIPTARVRGGAGRPSFVIGGTLRGAPESRVTRPAPRHMESSPATAHELKGKRGLPRLISAFRNSVAGFRHAYATEDAFRQELLALALAVPLSLLLPVTALEHLMLVLSMIFVLVVEILNTAIESTVDRIGFERHPLAGKAKDLGSSAVLLSLVMTGLCWAVIAGPVLVRWMRG